MKTTHCVMCSHEVSALSDVERAACAAIAEIRRLPQSQQGAAFVLAVKIVIEGDAVQFDASSAERS